jgi:hypothetical protein
MRARDCECGERFELLHGNQTLCGECRQERHRAKLEAWRTHAGYGGDPDRFLHEYWHDPNDAAFVLSMQSVLRRQMLEAEGAAWSVARAGTPVATSDGPRLRPFAAELAELDAQMRRAVARREKAEALRAEKIAERLEERVRRGWAAAA